jgi:hypothetical protein
MIKIKDQNNLAMIAFHLGALYQGDQIHTTLMECYDLAIKVTSEFEELYPENYDWFEHRNYEGQDWDEVGREFLLSHLDSKNILSEKNDSKYAPELKAFLKQRGVLREAEELADPITDGVWETLGGAFLWSYSKRGPKFWSILSKEFCELQKKNAN